jgi:hypothetical protein
VQIRASRTRHTPTRQQSFVPLKTSELQKKRNPIGWRLGMKLKDGSIKNHSAFLSLSFFLFVACGDLEESTKKLKGEEQAASQQAGPDKNQTTVGADSPSGSSGGSGMCLTNCDNGVWKNLMFEELTIQNPTIAEGCQSEISAAFPRPPNLEILAVVSCSGLSRLYRWSVNNLGVLVDTPNQIGQCLLGQKLNQIRRSVGSNGALTLWNCFDTNNYSNRFSYTARVEDLAGNQLYARNIFSSYYRSEVEIAYAKDVDLWAVAFKGVIHRLNKSGVLSGSTTWSNASEPRNLVVRDGVFQVMEGDHYYSAKYCSRVTFGGTLLCKSNSVGNRFDSSQPVEGSRYLLMQDGEEISAGSDTPADCSVTGEALTITRHSENHAILRALAINATPYIAMLAVSDDKLIFDLLQTSPSMQHLTSLPLEDSGKWLKENIALFQMGERVYATLASVNGVRVVSIPKPGATK